MRSYRGEIIMFTADANMAGWGFHWVNQLRKGGYEHWVMLADRRVRGIGRLGAAWRHSLRADPSPTRAGRRRASRYTINGAQW